MATTAITPVGGVVSDASRARRFGPVWTMPSNDGSLVPGRPRTSRARRAPNERCASLRVRSSLLTTCNDVYYSRKQLAMRSLRLRVCLETLSLFRRLVLGFFLILVLLFLLRIARKGKVLTLGQKVESLTGDDGTGQSFATESLLQTRSDARLIRGQRGRTRTRAEPRT